MALRGRIRLDYTCGRFFDDCLRDPEAILGDAARTLSLSIDWRDPGVLDALVQVRDGYYYPLISTMFLCDPSGPQNTPVQAALEYIRWKDDGRSLAGSDFSDDASRKWAESLAAHLEERSDEQVSVTIRSGGRLLVRVMSDMVEVLCDGQSRIFDICVMASSPGDALRVLAFDTATAAFGVQVGRILDSVCETDDESARYGEEGVPPSRLPGASPGSGAGWRPDAWDGNAPGNPSAQPQSPSTRPAPEDRAWAAFRRHVFDVSVKARADIRALNEAFVEGWREGGRARSLCRDTAAAVRGRLALRRRAAGAVHGAGRGTGQLAAARVSPPAGRAPGSSVRSGRSRSACRCAAGRRSSRRAPGTA